MRLEDGKTYRDGYGMSHTIGGPCKDHPDWVWTIGGEWFDRATGRRIEYGRTPSDPTQYEHRVSSGSYRDIVAGIPDPAIVPDPWDCPRCTQRNTGWALTCGRCGTAHPGANQHP